MAHSLKIVSAKKINEQLLDKNLLHGKEVMDKIRVLINKMEEFEISNFKGHRKIYEPEKLFTPMLIFQIMIFSLLVFIISYVKIDSDLRSLNKSNDDLMITNESRSIIDFLLQKENLVSGLLLLFFFPCNLSIGFIITSHITILNYGWQPNSTFFH